MGLEHKRIPSAVGPLPPKSHFTPQPRRLVKVLVPSSMQSWTVGFWLHCAFLLCVFSQAGAVNLDQCKANFANETGQTQFTYQQCVHECGGGAGDFQWTMFSQDFSTWLLPWIALMFQLPFGATDRIDNLVSVLLAIGSPALAGYSLAITRLNSRWLSRQFLDIHFPNRINVPSAVSALQHIPFKIDVSGPFLPSVIVLPQNDRYWKLLGVAAKRTRQWSIPVAMNIVWALVALLFTIVDSFVDFNYFITVPGDAGYSIAALWTYLLPVVVGWLYVGSQVEADHLRDALNDAHEVAYVATASEPALATRMPSGSTRAIEPSTRLIDHVNADEKKTVPIFNYSRVFIWSQHAEHILRLYEHAATKAERKITVQRGGEWMSEDADNMVAQDRIGNEAEVVQYCMKGPAANPYPWNGFLQPPTLQPPTPFAPYSAFPPSIPSVSSKYDEETMPMGFRAEEPVFATEVFQRVVFAAALGLFLQWGTTGASIIIHIHTPPTGIGCRVLTFLLYAGAGTLAFLLLLFSSISAHLVRPRSVRKKRSALEAFIGWIAAFTRWSGKTIAIINGLAILVSCGLQFGGIYDNCFCSSTIFGGNPSGLVSFTAPNIRGSELYTVWIGGIVMAFGVSGLYSFAIYVATPTR